MKTMAQLKYHYGLKFRIFPSDQQKKIIKINSDASRFVYNNLVASNKEMYFLKRIKCYIGLVDQRLTELRKRQNVRYLSNHYTFLNGPLVDSMAKANAKQSYQKAWNLYRKIHKAGVPKFHRKSYVWKYQTSCIYSNKITSPSIFTGSIRFVDKKHILLPKLGKLRFKNTKLSQKIFNRDAETRIGTVTIEKDNTDAFFVSFQLASDMPFVEHVESTGKQVGIDLNLDNFLTTSDNIRIENPKYYRNQTGRLAHLQRTLARRQRRAKKEKRKLANCKNYQKQRRLVAKLQRKISNQRDAFLHNLSTTFVKSHDLVVAEELRSSNMLKNHALAMSISDVGWRKFLQMLTYKADLYNRTFITVDPKNTTQTCSNCGFVMGTNGTQKLTLDIRNWTCPNCHFDHIRDQNAAINILHKGLAVLAQTNP